jgi:undecaprenyl-diphosphatase
MSVMVYGSLAILVARGVSSRRRWLPFAGACAISLLVAFSRIYLGAHWLSDVIGGLSLGWAWVALLGSYYLRQNQSSPPIRLLLVTVALTLLLAGSWHVQARHLHDTARYQTTAGQS